MNYNYILLGILCLGLFYPISLEATDEYGSIEETPSAREAVRLVEKQKILSQKATKAFLGLLINSKIPEF